MSGIACGRKQSGQPVHVRHDVVGDGIGLDLARPAHHGGYPVGPFPVGVLLASEGRHAGVGPGVHVRAVVGAIEDNRVVGNTQIIELLEHRAHVLVMVDHGVVVGRLPASRLAPAFRFDMGSEVHMGEIHPDKERLTGLVLFLYKFY